MARRLMLGQAIAIAICLGGCAPWMPHLVWPSSQEEQPVVASFVDREAKLCNYGHALSLILQAPWVFGQIKNPRYEQLTDAVYGVCLTYPDPDATDLSMLTGWLRELHAIGEAVVVVPPLPTS